MSNMTSLPVNGTVAAGRLGRFGMDAARLHRVGRGEARVHDAGREGQAAGSIAQRERDVGR